MSLKPKPQSWDDVQPGDVITWSDTKWSRKLGRPTERPRRLLVRVVEQRRDTSAETVRVVQGVMVTKTDQPNKVMNNYPLTDANHVSTGEMGWCGPLAVDWITSLDRPSYVEEPEATPVAKPVKLTDAQWSAINRVSGLDCRGYFSSYAIPTITSAALVGKGIITPIVYIDGFGRQWLTREGFKAAGIDLDTVICEARNAALIEHVERGHNPANIVHGLDELADDTQIHAYARGVEVAEPKFPKGTPEYEAYVTELHAELEKFAKGEAPYEYTARDDARLAADLFTGRADRKALPIVPPTRPFRQLINDAINEAVDAAQDTAGRVDKVRWARHYELTAEIERRLNLAVAFMPVEVRQILDGRA